MVVQTSFIAHPNRNVHFLFNVSNIFRSKIDKNGWKWTFFFCKKISKYVKMLRLKWLVDIRMDIHSDHNMFQREYTMKYTSRVSKEKFYLKYERYKIYKNHLICHLSRRRFHRLRLWLQFYYFRINRSNTGKLRYILYLLDGMSSFSYNLICNYILVFSKHNLAQ